MTPVALGQRSAAVISGVEKPTLASAVPANAHIVRHQIPLAPRPNPYITFPPHQDTSCAQAHKLGLQPPKIQHQQHEQQQQQQQPQQH
jgi:hypothetical protein